MYALSLGDPVMVHAIKDKPDMNGLFGTVVGQRADMTNENLLRWKVQFEDGTVCCLQPKNLKLRMPVPVLLARFRVAILYDIEQNVRDLLAKAHMRETTIRDAKMALRTAFMAICEFVSMPDGRRFPLMWCDTVPNITASHTVSNANDVEIQCLYTASIFEQLAGEFDRIVNMQSPELKLSPGNWMFPTNVCRTYTFADRMSSENDVSPNVSATINILKGILADMNAGNEASGAKVRMVNL